jgi:hypothetical protein
MQRKQGNEPKVKNGKKRDRDEAGNEGTASAIAKPAAYSANQVLPSANMYRNPGNSGASNITVNQSQKDLARVAVGKGVRHGFVPNPNNNGAAAVRQTYPTPSVVAPSPVQASLNALTNNYRNSLNELQNADQGGEAQGTVTSDNGTAQRASSFTYVPGSLRRDDSLVDLAMIPLAEEGTETNNAAESSGFLFVDFPFDPDFLTNDLNDSSQD